MSINKEKKENLMRTVMHGVVVCVCRLVLKKKQITN